MAIKNYNGERMKTVTVAELIELLQEQDPNARVIFSTNYGDYHRTMQALPICGEIEEAVIEKSAYSNSGFAVASTDEDDDEESGDDNYEPYLVIK